MSIPVAVAEDSLPVVSQAQLHAVPVRLESHSDYQCAEQILPGLNVIWREEKLKRKPLQQWVYNSYDKTIALGCRPDLFLTAPKNNYKSVTLQPQISYPNQKSLQKWILCRDGSIVLESDRNRSLSAEESW